MGMDADCKEKKRTWRSQRAASDCRRLQAGERATGYLTSAEIGMSQGVKLSTVLTGKCLVLMRSIVNLAILARLMHSTANLFMDTQRKSGQGIVALPSDC